MQKKIASSSLGKTETLCSTSVDTSEKEQTDTGDETCTYSGNEPSVTMSTVHPESSVLSESSEIIETVVASETKESDLDQVDDGSQLVLEQTQGEISQTSELQHLHAGKSPNISGQEVSQRRRTILWEPLLVPSETDGKVEMVTALKRVDSDYVINPKTNPRKPRSQVVKDSHSPTSPKSKIQHAIVHTNPFSKVVISKESVETGTKYGSKKGVLTTTRKGSDVTINEQMGRAIAEKEAVILKEIAKAMKEVSNPNKSVSGESEMSQKIRSSTLNEQSKLKSSASVVPKQNVKKMNVEEAQKALSSEARMSTESPDSIGSFPDNGREIYLQDGTKLVQCPPVKEMHGINRILTVPGPVFATTTANEIHVPSSMLTMSGRIVTSQSPVVGSVSKEAQSVSKILTVPGKMMMAPTSGTDVQAINKVFCGPTAVLATPTSSMLANAPIDAHTLNKLIAVPVNTKSSKEGSPTSIQRIFLLAAPPGTVATSGGIPLLTPIIPTSGLPVVTHAHAGLPSKTVKRGSTEMRESKKISKSRGKVLKSVSDLEHITQIADSTSTDTKECGAPEKGLSVKTIPISHKKVKTSHDSVIENTQVPPSQNMQPALEITKPLRCYSKQTLSPPLAVKNPSGTSVGLSGEKKVSALPANKPNAPSDQQEVSKVNTNTLCDVTVNGKPAGKNPSMQEGINQSSSSDMQVMDCNGGSMDVDDESISEELDQVSNEDLRNIVDQKSVIAGAEAKHPGHSQGNKSYVKEIIVGKSTRNATRSKTMDVSSDVLENRLQRIERLYCQIPPAKARISLTEEEYSKLRDSFRESMHVVKTVTAACKNLIGQSDHLTTGCKRYVHSSCQTENLGENVITNVITNTVTLVTKDATGAVTDVKPDEVDDGLILCRLCGGFFKKSSLVTLFSKISKKRRLVPMLAAILPQSPPVKECDGLPQQVCVACIDKLTVCHNIINQFLQADKELRQVLQVEKQLATDSVSVDDCLAPLKEKQDSSKENETLTPVENNTANTELPNDTNTSKTLPRKEISKRNDRSSQVHCEKRTRTIVDSERLPAENSPPNHKHKRRRSKSPQRSGSFSKNSHASSKSSGCIDLSRLDPEFNDGFEVEWCLDEETIRSSLVPDEDPDPELNENSTGPDICGSPEGGIGTEKNVSTTPGIQGCAEFPADTLDLPPTQSSEMKANDSLGRELPKHVNEVSKLPEMHTSVCESTARSDNKQTPISAEEKRDVESNDLFKSQETYKCSSCPLSFPSKQEAFLHKVMLHEEELAGVLKPLQGKRDSSGAVESKDHCEKQPNLPDTKQSERCEEAMMCDQCGLSFPNEYSLCVHNCVTLENVKNPLSVIKNSSGSDTKVLNSKESEQENATCEEKVDAVISDGKVLVKCGRSGMLWVSCSKLFSDGQTSAAQSLDQSAVPCTSLENDTVSIVSSKQNASSTSPQSTARVQFAYKCDHCKKIFPSKSELLNHMQTHLPEEYSCSECGAKFSTMTTLNNHIPSHIPSDRVCSECGLILPDNKKLLLHKKEHTHNLPHMCESCGKRYPNEQTLEVHESIHYNKRGPLACSLCRKCFFFKHTLVRHRSQHSSNRLQKCSLCFRVLNTGDQLRKHVALHHLMKNFVCFCKQTFPSQKELVEHRYLKHSYAEIFCARYKVEVVEPLPLHQCSICFRVLNSKQSLLKHHVTSHSSTWPFYCIQCSRKYKSMLHLARHECHRKNASAFQCRICGKAFQNKNIFRQHRVIHNNKKWRYVCRHCGKAFQKSQSLVSHIMMHGGKKFSCPRCHLQCQDKEGLLKHYNTGSCHMKGKTSQ